MRMKKCEKFHIKCPYRVENKDSHCVATSKECDRRRSNALVFPKDCEMELPARWKTWTEVYNAYMDALPKGSGETLFFEYMEGDNKFLKKKLFVPYLIIMTCNEAFEEILIQEKFEGMAIVKKMLSVNLIKTAGIHASVLKQ